MAKSIRGRGPVLATLAAGALAVGMLAAFGPLSASSAAGTSNAANKMVAEGSTHVYLCTDEVKPSTFKTCAGTSGKTSKSTVTVLHGTVKTSSTVTLVIDVSMECSTVTDVSTKGSSTSTATAGVTVQVKVNGTPVPINASSASTSGKVTFCNRDLGLSTKTFGTTEIIGITDSTEYANAFNWVDVTVPQGTNSITLVTSLHAHATATSTTTLTVKAVAGIGSRTMIVTPAHTANNAQFSTTTL